MILRDVCFGSGIANGVHKALVVLLSVYQSGINLAIGVHLHGAEGGVDWMHNKGLVTARLTRMIRSNNIESRDSKTQKCSPPINDSYT